MKPARPARLRTRLRMWWLWRRCDWVYRFAHHALCDRFKRDVVTVGGLHVCRSCLLLYGALLIAAAAATWAQIGPAALTPSALALAMSWPPLYARLPRLARDLVRFLTGAAAGLALSMLLRGQWLPALAATAALAAAYLACLPAYRRQKSHACDGCPELANGGTCSGFRLQTTRILAFEPQATRIAAEMTNARMMSQFRNE